MPPKSKSKKDPNPAPKNIKTTPQKDTLQTTSKPNWPPIRPLPHPSSLTLTPLLHDQIYLIPHFLTAPLCKTYVSFLASLPLATTPAARPKKDEAVRVNDRFQIQDERFAEMLWDGAGLGGLVRRGGVEGCDGYNGYGYEGEDGEGGKEDEEERKKRMKELWGGEPLGLNANIRIYRYSKGQFFAQHYDDSNTIHFTNKTHSSTPARTTWTLLIYLSTCTGGETVFYPEPTRSNRSPEPVSVAPELGMALLHRHGERCLLHEGREVLSGEKWVLRSDLVVGR